MKKLFYAIISLFLFSGLVSAAGPAIYFKTDVSNLAPSSEFELSIFLNSKEEVNVFNLEINYPPDTLKFLGGNNSGSIVDVWQKPPTVLLDGEVSLIGGTLKPFHGENGLIVKLKFQTLKTGEVFFTLTNGKIYLANGLGTVIKAPESFYSINVTSEAPVVTLSPILDSTPPMLNAEIVTTPIEAGKILVFNSEDKESGTDYSTMRFKRWFSWSDSQQIINPAPLPAHAWQLEIKTVNNAGLETNETLYLWEEILKKIGLLLLVLLGMILIFRVAPMGYNKYKRK
ncbi:MAG: cohesin domain-containing protein [Patescibacteria group bacterium]